MAAVADCNHIAPARPAGCRNFTQISRRLRVVLSWLSLFGFSSSAFAGVLWEGFFLRGESGHNWLLSKEEAALGGMTKAVWGLHQDEFYHGFSGTLRRFNNFKLAAARPESYRLELAGIGIDEEFHWRNWILGGGLEGGRLMPIFNDLRERYVYYGGSFTFGYALFSNRYIHLSAKLAGFTYFGDRYWRDFAGNSPLQGLAFSIAINLNDSRTKPLLNSKG